MIRTQLLFLRRPAFQIQDHCPHSRSWRGNADESVKEPAIRLQRNHGSDDRPPPWLSGLLISDWGLLIWGFKQKSRVNV